MATLEADRNSRIDRLTEHEALIELYKSFSDPVVFGEWLYESPLEEWQRETLRSFAKGGRVARAVCNGGGKTRLFAIAGTWFLVVRKNPRVVMTAGVYRQLDAMRDELAIPVRAGKLEGFKLLEHELIHPDGSKFLWYSSDNPGLFEGQHSDSLALLIDEAKSVANDIALASQRLQATHTLAMSSPAAASGWFYDCFSSQKEFWNTKQIRADTVKRISKDWIAEMRRMHVQHPELLASMLDAEFTSNDPNSLIRLEWINRNLEAPPRWIKGHVVAGIDLSASLEGDESVIVIRDGNKITQIIAWRDSDAMRVAGRCILELTTHNVPKGNVYADSGGLGAGIVARMQELGWPVNGIQFGGNPMAKTERVINRMTELWDNMAEEISNQRIILMQDDKLIAQLTIRKSVVTSSGRLKLETKAEMRKHGVQSPDRADALALALLVPQGALFSNSVYKPTEGYDAKSEGSINPDGFDLGR